MTRIELRSRQVGPWPMNSYVLVCPDTKQSVLIDPGADPALLNEMLEESTPIAILLTHTHPDHIGALEEMRHSLNVPVIGNDGPHEPLGKDVGLDEVLQDGDSFRLGNNILNVQYAPGHIGDQICFVIEGEDRVIVGDTLFEGGPGKTWSSEGFETTLKTLREVVLSWSDNTYCFAGHGNDFRLGNIRSQIEAFLAKDHGDFYGDATWDM